MPDVPMTRSNPRCAIWSRYDPISFVTCFTRRRSSRFESGSVRTNRSVSRMTPALKLRPTDMCVAVPTVTSTLPPPMSTTTAVLPPTSTP